MRPLNDKSTDTMFSMLTKLVTSITTKMSGWPQQLQPEIIVALKAARGFLAPFCPTPGYLGSSLADVEFIHQPAGHMPGIVDGVPKIGRLVASKLRRDDFWKDLVSEYKRFMGPGQEVGKAVVKAAETLAMLVQARLTHDG